MSAATDGCTGCASQDTVTIDGFHGRRCSACPPTLEVGRVGRLGRTTAATHVRALLPAGDFQTELAADMVAVDRPHAAFSYLGAWLGREIDERFGGLR